MEQIKTENELRTDIEAAFGKLSIKNTSANAVYPLFIDAFVEPMAVVYERLKQVQDNSLPTRATGVALDVHGVGFGVERLNGSSPIDVSNSNVYIYLSNDVLAKDVTTDGLGIMIPAGTQLFGGPIPFYTLNQVYIAPASNGTYVNVIGSKVTSDTIAPGTINGISIDYNLLTNLTDASLGTTRLLATNYKYINGGSYLESDSDYRNRLTLANKTYHSKMQSALEYTVYSVPGVVSMSVRDNTHGVGTKSLIVLCKDIIASDALISAVQSKIAELGDSSVKVMRPEYISVQITNKIVYAPAKNNSTDITAINQKITIAQKAYINNLRNGATLSLSSLEQAGMDAAAGDVTSLKVSCVKLDNRYCSVTDQRSGWDEKFVTYDEIDNPPIIFIQ